MISSTPESVMNSWMNSSEHKENILNSTFTSIGIGCFYHNNNYYWVQCFSNGNPEELITYLQNETKKVQIAVSGGAITYSISDEYKTIEMGEEKELKINGVHFESSDYSYPFILDGDNFEWSSKDESILTVQDGKITAKKAGYSIIQAKLENGVSITCEVEVIDNIKGDLNNDGIINILDITYGYVKLEYDDITDEELERADVTGEGVYNISDINKMYLYLEGKIDNL